MRGRKFNVGDRVAYARTFLQSTGMITGEVPFLRGTVDGTLEIGGRQVAHVLWDGHDEPIHVLSSNLWPADKLHLEPA